MENDLYTRLEKLILESTDNTSLQSPAAVLAEVGCPTTSIAILEDGQISPHCISTINDNVSTLFQACSISKPAAGLVIMRLIELDYFTLDSLAIHLLPPTLASTLTPNPSLAALWQKITIKHLMSHTAGLSIDGLSGYANHATVPSAAEVLTSTNNANSQPVQPLSPPGLEYSYSGGGITVLQCIIEHVTSQPFAKVMQTHLFQPLSMTRSFYNPLPASETNLSHCYHHGYTPTSVPWHILPEQAAAGLWSTPTDLLKMLRALQDSLAGKPGALLKQETAQMMLTRVKPDQSDMGLTWFTTETAMGHSGSNDPGWRCYLFGSRDTGKGVAIMTNSKCGNAAIWKVAEAVSWLKGWGVVPSFNGSLAWGCPFGLRIEGAVYDSVWRGWVGKWGSGAAEGFVWSIEEREGGPVVQTEQGVMLNLKPAAMPARQYDRGKRSWDLVVEGLPMVLRLGWDGDERVVELWSELSGMWRTLRKRESHS